MKLPSIDSLIFDFLMAVIGLHAAVALVMRSGRTHIGSGEFAEERERERKKLKLSVSLNN